MLSKEEIEEAKETLKNNKVLFGIQRDICLQARVSIEKLIEYTEQLETKEQKLIEILNKYEHEIANEDTAISMYAEFKEILKGEKE